MRAGDAGDSGEPALSLECLSFLLVSVHAAGRPSTALVFEASKCGLSQTGSPPLQSLPFPFALEGTKGPLESWVSLVWSVPNGIHLPRNTNRLDSEIDKFGVFVKGKRGIREGECWGGVKFVYDLNKLGFRENVLSPK